MGNPCETQPFFKEYVIVFLQNLERLNGKDITRADRIVASQVLKQHIDEINQMKFHPQNPDWDAESDNSDYEENDANTKIKRAADETA